MPTSAYTIAQTERLTRPDIIRALLRETDLGLYGTMTGGTSSTLVDATRLTNYPDDHFRDWWAYNFTDSTIGYATSSTQSTGSVATSTMTTNAQGDAYALIKSIHPQEVLDFLDDIMKNEVFLPEWAPLTYCVDGDMEQNNVTDWTAGGSATPTKVSSEPAMNGKRWLRVANSGANGYARSNLISVPLEARQWEVSALVRCESGTASLIVYDETNSAALATVSTTSKGIVRLHTTFQTDATTAQFSIRCSGVQSNADTYWDDVVVYPVEAREMPLPWWVKTRDGVREFFRLIPVSAGDGLWQPGMTGEEDKRWMVKHSRFGRGQLIAENMARDGMQEPVYFYGLRNEEAWASNTETKHVDQRLIVAHLAVKCYERVYDSVAMTGADAAHYRAKIGMWQQKLDDMKRKLSETEDELNVPVQRTVSVGRSRYGGDYGFAWRVR